MKRRTFLRGIAAAVAIGLSPAFLNATKLKLATTERDLQQVTLTIKKILANGAKETIDRLAYEVIDRGTDVMVKYRPMENENLTEIGVGGPAGYQRFQLDQPVTVMSDEELEVIYEYRTGAQVA